MRKKNVFITGANGGIGRAMILAFAKTGADIYANIRRENAEFEGYYKKIAKDYKINITPVIFDITDSEAMKNAIRELIAAKTPIDVLINNAGVAHGGLFQMTAISKIREIFDINFFAQIELTQLLLRWMIKNGGGSVINMASISGQDLLAGNCAYGVSKAALIAFTKTLAAECGTTGVRINAIAPSLVNTKMADLMEEDAGKKMLEQSAMNRKADPQEIADVAVFLASDKASFINGQIIRVDGGKK